MESIGTQGRGTIEISATTTEERDTRENKSVVRVTQLETGTMGLETGVEGSLSSGVSKKSSSMLEKTAQLHLKAIP